jgi:YVTN family beta-propeller protein
VGSGPIGVAVHPAGTRVYVTNYTCSTVSVLDTATNTVLGAPIPVGSGPIGIDVHPAGTRVYVVNNGSDTVSVIDTATATVTATLPVGSGPIAFGQFIGGTRLTPLSSCAWGLYIDDHTTGGSWESRLFLANIDPQQAHTYEVVVLATDTVHRTSLRLGPNGIVQVTCDDVPACGAAGWLSVQSDASVFAATLFVLNNTFGGGRFTAQTPLCVVGGP